MLNTALSRSGSGGPTHTTTVGFYRRILLLWWFASIGGIIIGRPAALLIPGVVAQESVTLEGNLTHDGYVRLFVEYRPASFVPGNPALIALHGAYGKMRDVLNPAFPMKKLANQYGVLILAPNAANLDTNDTLGTNQTWNDLRDDGIPSTMDDVGFLAKLADWAVAQRGVDRRRVYLLGVSSGGTMTYRCLMETTSPPRYAAAVSFLATLPVQSTVPPPNITTPLCIFLGTKDKLAQWNGGEFGLGLRGALLPALDTRDYWVAANQADPTKVVITNFRNKRWLDRCRLQSQFYPPRNASSGAPVLLYVMRGGGHWVPSNKYALIAAWTLVPKLGPLCREAEGGILAWDFLSQYQLKPF
jgi:polyhydroxybutyrate depolymerase